MDKERGETRRQGDKENRSQHLSPCLPLSLSPCLDSLFFVSFVPPW